MILGGDRFFHLRKVRYCCRRQREICIGVHVFQIVPFFDVGYLRRPQYMYRIDISCCLVIELLNLRTQPGSLLFQENFLLGWGVTTKLSYKPLEFDPVSTTSVGVSDFIGPKTNCCSSIVKPNESHVAQPDGRPRAISRSASVNCISAFVGASRSSQSV